MVSTLREQLAQVQREAVQRERELSEERRRNEDERRRNELDALRKENEMRMAALEAKMAAGVPKAEAGGGLKELAAVFAPVIQQMIQGQNEMRAMTMKVDSDRAAQSQSMLTSLLAKPAIDPTLLAILEKGKTDAAPMASMLHTMAESQMTSAKAMMEMVRTAADLGLGGGPPKENFALNAIKEAVKGVEAMVKGYTAAVYDKNNPKRQAGPGLPAGQQSYQQQAAAPVPQQAPKPVPQARVTVEPTAAQAAREAFLKSPAGKAQEAASMIGREPPPVPVQQFPRAVPVAAEPQGEMVDAGATIIDEIENDIKEHVRAEAVAEKFLDSLNNPVMKVALDKFDGEYEKMFADRLLGWIMSAPSEHGPYVKEVLEEVNRLGLERGVFEPEDGGEPEDATA